MLWGKRFVLWIMPAVIGSVLAAGVCFGAGTFVFSLDIGSDTELSDPTPDGNEGFDPGDTYRSDITGIIGTADGTDGTGRDDYYLRGADPHPDAENSPIPVPVGTCTPPGPPTCYNTYFDLDGYDVVNIQLTSLAPPAFTPPYLKADLDAAFGLMGWLDCIFEARFVMVSFDDDVGRGWASDRPKRVSEESLSPMGSVYGRTDAKDEVMGVNLNTTTAFPFEVDKIFGFANEMQVHPELTKNPDVDDSDDDDVDALDMLASFEVCDVFLYSADREATDNLLAGAIYQEGIVAPVIRPVVHLGIPKSVDIDAFELAWLPDASGDLALGLLFSVDDDDPRTFGVDESGGLDPGFIYGSFLDGGYFDVFNSTLTGELYAVSNSNFLHLDKTTGAAISAETLADVVGSLASTSDNSFFAVKNDELIEIDPLDPTRVIPPITLTASLYCKGLSFNSSDELYAIDYNGPSYGSQLVKIDIETGKVTDIGATGKSDIQGLAFNSKDELWAVDALNNEVCQLDPITGAATCMVMTVSYPDDTDDFSLDFDADDRLYMANTNLAEIENYDTAPNAVLIGATGHIAIHGLAFGTIKFDDIDAITISETDLYEKGLNQPIYYEKD